MSIDLQCLMKTKVLLGYDIGHIFRQTNLNRWFESNPRCPLCRYDIREYNRNNTNAEENVTNDVDSLSSGVATNEDIQNTSEETKEGNRLF